MASWANWVAASVTGMLAVAASFAGAELVRALAARRLEALRTAHWTEQARIYTQANAHAHLFRSTLIAMTAVLALFGVPQLGPQGTLRFAALLGASVMVLGDPFVGRWIRRATAGALVPVPWRDQQRFGLLMFPARWVLLVFAVLAPERYDALG